MNRKVLIGLFKDGMRYKAGKHRVWVSKCFEITVYPNQVVELDEYENVATTDEDKKKLIRTEQKGMFHVGRSVLHLKDGQVTEQTGEGWEH